MMMTEKQYDKLRETQLIINELPTDKTTEIITKTAKKTDSVTSTSQTSLLRKTTTKKSLKRTKPGDFMESTPT